jgi:hypothetical protein
LKIVGRQRGFAGQQQRAGTIVNAGGIPGGDVVGVATAGVAPRIMGFGPAPAVRKVLAQTGLTLVSLASSSAQAPSLTPEAFPAVTLPSARTTPRSLASASSGSGRVRLAQSTARRRGPGGRTFRR